MKLRMGNSDDNDDNNEDALSLAGGREEKVPQVFVYMEHGQASYKKES